MDHLGLGWCHDLGIQTLCVHGEVALLVALEVADSGYFVDLASLLVLVEDRLGGGVVDTKLVGCLSDGVCLENQA